MEQSGRKPNVAIVMKNYFTQFMGVILSWDFSSLVYMEYLYCIVQQCSNISCMGSLDKTILNLQLYTRYFYFMMLYRSLRCLYVQCVVALLTFRSARGECFFSVTCLLYIVRCSCRIYMLLQSREDYIQVSFRTNHFL